jgi:tetratricopeptide (TPR) repeat protein
MSNDSKAFSNWQEALQYCVSLHEQGRIVEAEEGYAQIVRAQPGNAEAMRLRGLALAQLGQAEEGLPHLQEARRLVPGHPLVHLHLGYALKLLERNAEAAKSFRAAALLAPRDPSPCINLAAVLIDLRQFSEAIPAAQAAVALAPTSPEAQHNLGLAYLEQGTAEAALAPLEAAVRLQPHFPEAWMHLGRARADLGRLEDAATAYLECLRQDPSHTGAAVNLANVWLRRGLSDEAIDLYRQVTVRHPERWEARLSLASALAGEYRTEEALTLLEGVTPPEHHRHTVLLQRIAFLIQGGRRDDAQTLLAGVRQQDLAYWSARFALDEDPDVRAETAAHVAAWWREEGHALFEDRVRAAFLLADHHHRQGLYGEAFDYFAAGHALLRQAEPYNAEVWEQEMEEEFAQFEALQNLGAPFGPDERMPVFIVGMPRSGTSMLEQILDSHSMVHGAGELPDIPRMAARLRLQGLDAGHLGTLAAEHLQRLRGLAPGSPLVTDKMPHNFQHLGLISTLFPGARIVYCKRNARDNCLSIFQQRFVDRHAYAHDLRELGSHYRAHEHIIRRWQERIPNLTLTVHYEEMVGDLEGQVRRLLEFLDLPYEPACLDFHENPRKVRTASRAQVTQPLYSSSVARWKPYAEYLTPLFAALEND